MVKQSLEIKGNVQRELGLLSPEQKKWNSSTNTKTKRVEPNANNF
jgi:hypothetical protein